ncbi:MAG: glycosyltransferase family 2 protein [Bacteroidales bacterium]|jgi:dolichol-phosphate mannosyltransferase|nr:glycosyltransferase family 2 protein [Bacteroidales bacterium]MDD4214371.1 glycosyltransferase family 2 protein [Bacteroidales bacterium]
MPLISIVIPCFNEGENVELVCAKLLEYSFPDAHTEILFVDDGSADNTLQRIKSLADKHKGIVKYISLSRNFGHQNALFAGISTAKGDCIIMMDGDMQHPPEIVPQMVEKWKEGFDIVYTIREQDKSLSLFKRFTSKLYYRLLNAFSDIKVDMGAADFRLIDRKVADVIKNDINESFLFLRGIFNWVGFNKFAISYMPHKRHAGKSKYTFRKMFALATSGIFSFSIKPLRLATYLGLFMSLVSFAYGFYALFMNIFTEKTVSGWTSVIFSILFVGGIIMILLGIIGEYIGRIYVEVKKRPRFLIKDSNYNKTTMD